jgi:hypothetical protein
MHHAHITDYRAGSYRYTGAFIGDAAAALLIEQGLAQDLPHAQALMSVLIASRAIRRVPLVQDEEFQLGRILHQLECHQWIGVQITQRQFITWYLF